MKNGLEVKSIDFGELRELSLEELRDSMKGRYHEPVDGASIKLVLANNSGQLKKAFIYTVAMADIPESSQCSWGQGVDVNPGEQEELNYIAPMIGVSSSDFMNYTGPLRYVVEVRVSESGADHHLFKQVNYYDIPAKVAPDELAKKRFDISKALAELKKTTVLHDLHIGGNPGDGVKSISVKLLNFGEKPQYIGIDTRAERKGSGHQTQFFYEVGPKEEISVDVGSFIPGGCPMMEYLRITAVCVPEQVFRSIKGRAWLLGEAYNKILIAKHELYFGKDE